MIDKSESISQIAKALLIFDAEVSKVGKTAENPFFKNKYAPLPEILDAVKDPLIKAGLTVKQIPIGEHNLYTILIHAESGEYIGGEYTMRPTKDDPQGNGSRITYQRRYSIGAILGLNIDEDDDGNKASQPAKQQTKASQPEPKLPASNIETSPEFTEAMKLIESCDTTERLKLIWETYKVFQPIDAFKKATNSKKKELTKTLA